MMFGAKQFNKLGDPFLFGIVIYSNKLYATFHLYQKMYKILIPLCKRLFI